MKAVPVVSELLRGVPGGGLFKGKVNIDDVYDNYKALSGENSEEEA